MLGCSRGCIKNDHIIECTPRCFQSRQSSYVFWMEKNLIHNPLLDRGEERIRIECCQSVNNSSSYLDCKMWFVKCQYKCIEKIVCRMKNGQQSILRYITEIYKFISLVLLFLHYLHEIHWIQIEGVKLNFYKSEWFWIVFVLTIS